MWTSFAAFPPAARGQLRVFVVVGHRPVIDEGPYPVARDRSRSRSTATATTMIAPIRISWT